MSIYINPPSVIQALRFRTRVSAILLLSTLNGKESHLLLLSMSVYFCCQSGVSESFLLCVQGQKWKVQVDKNSIGQRSTLTPRRDGLLLIRAMVVALELVLAVHCQLHAHFCWHYTPLFSHSVVRVTAGWTSCFRLTFKPRETWVTRFKPDGVFIPYILFKLFDFEHIDTGLKEKL